MWNFFGPMRRCRQQVSRRDLLQVGALSLAELTLADDLRLRAAASATAYPGAVRGTSVILIRNCRSVVALAACLLVGTLLNEELAAQDAKIGHVTGRLVERAGLLQRVLQRDDFIGVSTLYVALQPTPGLAEQTNDSPMKMSTGSHDNTPPTTIIAIGKPVAIPRHSIAVAGSRVLFRNVGKAPIELELSVNGLHWGSDILGVDYGVEMLFPNAESDPILIASKGDGQLGRGWLLIWKNRYAGVSDSEGRFIFADVPIGLYQLRVWRTGDWSAARVDGGLLFVTVQEGVGVDVGDLLINKDEYPRARRAK